MQNSSGRGPDAYQQEYRAAVDHLGNGRLEQAQAAYRSLLSRYPGRAELHNDYGHLLRVTGRMTEAVEHFELALQQSPEMFAAAYNLALSQSQLGDRESAIENYRRALTINPQLVEAHNNLANLLRRQGDPESAIGHYRKALKLRPDFLDAAANLSLSLEKMHQLDEAARIADEVIQKTPGHPVASLVLARVETRNGRLEAALKRLDDVRGGELSPIDEATLAAELGKIYDRMGRHAEAVNVILGGKRIWREVLGPGRSEEDRFLRRIRRNLEWCAAANLADWPSALDDSVSIPIFLVGFPRSGTTLTEQVLSAHPRLVASNERPVLNRVIKQAGEVLGRDVAEPEGFSELDADALTRLRRHYWSIAQEQLGPRLDGKRLVDKMPLNLVELGFVRRLFPESPVVTVLRDPRDSCISGFFQAFEMNQAMLFFLDMNRTAELYDAVMNSWLRYRDSLGLDWLEVRYEDLVDDFEPQARRLLEHVGVSWDDDVNRFNELAAQKFANTPSYQDVTRPLFRQSIGRWRNYRSLVEPVTGRLSPYISAFGYSP